METGRVGEEWVLGGGMGELVEGGVGYAVGVELGRIDGADGGCGGEGVGVVCAISASC